MLNQKFFFEPIKEKKYSLRFVYSVLFLILISSCTSGPEPLYYKKDSCAFCKMQLMDTKFGAELITEKGKIYKFDDTGCMLDFEQQNLGMQKIAQELVIDYSQPGKLTNAVTAYHIKCGAAKSPMGSDIASFEKEENLNKYIQQLQGEKISWMEIKNSFNK